MNGGYYPADLEIRQLFGISELRVTFRYEDTGVVRDRGKIRKETVAQGAFQYAIDHPERPIELLYGHNFNTPIASRQSGTMTVEGTNDAVTIVAKLPPAELTPTYLLDLEKNIERGVTNGVSPGFRVPPPDVVPNAEELIPEPGNPGVSIRRINFGLLREMSIVQAAVFQSGTVEMRADDDDGEMDWSDFPGRVIPVARRLIVPSAASLWL